MSKKAMIRVDIVESLQTKSDILANRYISAL